LNFQKREILERKKERELNKKTKMYSEYYELYKEVGFNEFVSETNYLYSLENLVTHFSKYVPEFIPQSRIKRGQ
jgi:citrate lyase synthetase